MHAFLDDGLACRHRDAPDNGVDRVAPVCLRGKLLDGPDDCCPSSSNARWSRSRVRLQGGPWRHSDDISLSAEGVQADTADAMVDVMKQLGEVRERAHCIDSDIDLPLRIFASAKTEASSSTLLLVQHAIPGTTQIVGRSGTSVTRLIGRRHPRASTMVILSC